MKIVEVTEGFTPAYSKSGKKTVRKYRCTSGPRKGRVVAKAATCTAPINVKARQSMKKTRAHNRSKISVKTKRTKKFNPTSLRVKRINKSVHKTKNKRRSPGKRKRI